MSAGVREYLRRLRALLRPDGDAMPNPRRVETPTDRVCGVTDLGRVRVQNQDTFRVAAADPLLVVADGMGGHAAGEVASALAVDAIAEFFDASRRRSIAEGKADVATLLVEAFDAAHARVCGAVAGDAALAGMGTTLVAAWVDAERLVTCHVGDARCYVHARGVLTRLTEDHSVVASLVRAGKLDAAALRGHPRRNEILQAVGTAGGIHPDVNSVVLAAGDRVLLCSDGLWDEVPDDVIAVVAGGEGSVADRAVALVDRALAAGGRDNVTVVLYEHELEGV